MFHNTAATSHFMWDLGSRVGIRLIKKIRFVSRWLCAALKSSKVGLQVACLTAATQEAPAGGGTCA